MEKRGALEPRFDLNKSRLVRPLNKLTNNWDAPPPVFMQQTRETHKKGKAWATPDPRGNPVPQYHTQEGEEVGFFSSKWASPVKSISSTRPPTRKIHKLTNVNLKPKKTFAAIVKQSKKVTSKVPTVEILAAFSRPEQELATEITRIDKESRIRANWAKSFRKFKCEW
jgi:hypothetical protein